jgi:small conductance mechanosensitive channel
MHGFDIKFFGELLGNIISFIPTIILAIVILIIGTLLNRLLLRMFTKGMDKGRFDKTLNTFLKNLLRILLTAIVIVIALTVLGIPMTSIIAVIGSAGIAVGLAMKDSLSNIAAGILVLYGKVFKVGDYVEIGGSGGTVAEIGIVYTKLTAPDGRDIFFPNTTVSSSLVVNFNSQKLRRLEYNIRLDYSVPTKTATEIIKGAVSEDKRIFTDGLFVRLSELSPTAQVITVRAFTPTETYWDVNYDLIERIKDALDEANIPLFSNIVSVVK